MQVRQLFAVLLVTLSAAADVLAWNELGHRTVAEIAWQQLEPAHRQQIVEVLRRHPRFGDDFVRNMTAEIASADKQVQDHWIFQMAAYWSDIARSLPPGELEKYNRPTWHYVTNPLFLSPSDREQVADRRKPNNSSDYPTDVPAKDYNVLQAIQHALDVINGPAGADNKALAYCWLFHLVGDIHQPLHSTSLYSVEQFPEGDRGGNSIPLRGRENLHWRWDSLLGNGDTMREVDREANELTDQHLYANEWELAARNLNPREWAMESHELCKQFVYSPQIFEAVRTTPAGERIEPIELQTEYMRQAGDIARRRVIMAGIRLSELLDQ